MTIDRQQLVGAYAMAMKHAKMIAWLPIDELLRDLYETESSRGVLDPSEKPEAKILRALLEVKRVVERNRA